MKKCIICGTEVKRVRMDNRTKYCSVECARKINLKKWHSQNKEWVRAYREKTKDRRNQRRRELYATNAELNKKLRDKANEWRVKNPLKKKTQRIKKYGLTITQFNQILEQQKYKCAICGYDDLSSKKFFPIIDHCHKNGKVRGLLCMNCNQGLGKFKDNPEFLDNAIAYLREANWA